MVLRDYSMRFYFLVARTDAYVDVIERGDGGPDTVELVRERKNGDVERVQVKLIRRARGEELSVAVRRIFIDTDDTRTAFERTFIEMPGVDGHALLKRWASGTWDVTREARYHIEMVMWRRATMEYLRERAADRSVFMALAKARALAKRYDVPQDDSFRFSRRRR